MNVGGLVEETQVCLAVYGEDLDPAAVAALLGCSPTSAHLRGDRRGPRSPSQKRGGWFLDLRGKAPEGPKELSLRLLDLLPRDENVWIKRGELHEVQLRFALHKTGWNRGFDFSPGTAARIALLHARCGEAASRPGPLSRPSSATNGSSPRPSRSKARGAGSSRGKSRPDT